MKVVITGGAGFLGRRLARALLQQGTLMNAGDEAGAINTLVLFDVVPAELPGVSDARLRIETGDITDRTRLAQIIDEATASVFHFAAVVSAAAEADFDLGMRINLTGTLAVLDACRALMHPPRVIFTSSVASFGGDLPEVVDDTTPLTPQSSYGTQKAIGDLLINEYTRKGFIDGRVLRLPTIVVRPGKPNQAASSFASGIIREPLSGIDAICPVTAETRVAILSPRRAVEAFLHAHDLPASAWGYQRSINVPALSVRVRDMVEALQRVAAGRPLGRIHWQPDAGIQRIVGSWPGMFTSARAQRLGFQTNASMDEIIRAYIEDDLLAAQPPSSSSGG
jgi:nucleoside-diphosphate-sugar epimerase